MKITDRIIDYVFTSVLGLCGAIVALSVVGILAFGIQGCTTTPTAPTSAQVAVANAVEDVLAVGLVPVLAKNPAYLTEAKAVAAALATFTGAELSSVTFDALLTKVNLPPEDKRTLSGLLSAALATYQRRYAEQVGSSLRPDVKLFCAAVSRGILNAVAATPQ